MEACSTGASNYRPSELVDAFHGISHVDINLREVPDEFTISLDYFQAIIIWACVPLLVCVCVFILMSVYYIIVCCCCCCRPKKSRSKSVNCCCAFFVSLVIVLSCGLLAAGMYAEFKLNENVVSAIDQADNVQKRISDIVNISGSFDSDSSSEAIRQLRSAIESSSGNNRDETLQNVDELSTELNETSAVYIAEVQNIAEAVNFESTTEDVRTYERIRHWTTVGYLILIIIILLLTSLILICCSTGCTILFLIIVGILTLLVWAVTGGALGGVIIVSDICSGPDDVVRNLTGSIDDNGVVDYYITCNESCSPFTAPLANARSGVDAVMSNYNSVANYAESNGIPNTVLAPVNDSVHDIRNIVESVSSGVMCSTTSGINEDYQNALHSLCVEGDLYSVILMALSVCLGLTLILLMCCLTCYAGLLASTQRENYEDTISEFDTARAQSWSGPRRASYSDEPYSGAYRTTTLSNQPPNYSDLSQQPRSVRRGSGEYDHF